MRNRARTFAALLLLAPWFPVARAAGVPPAVATEDSTKITLDNGIVGLDVAKKGFGVPSIRLHRDGRTIELGNGGNALYLDYNGGPRNPPADAGPAPKAGYDTLGGMCRSVRIASAGPEVADVAIEGEPTTWCPFRVEVHYLLRRGESGIYAYAIYRHGAGMPAGGIGQTRFVIKGAKGTSLFTHHVIDDQRKGPFPTGRVVETVQDATVRLEDGSVYTKYDNSTFTADDLVHGMAGHGVGVWTIWPSHEFFNGGPLRQDLTVHEENVDLAMLQGGHFGAGGIDVDDNEVWSRFYGPVFFYVNGGDSIDAMWADAKRRAAEERAAWPYAWVHHDDFPLKRGTVGGSIRLDTGAAVKDAWVVLAPPEKIDWTLSAKGYMFYTRTKADGSFRVEKIRPGKYTLFVSGANQFEDFRRQDVEVSADGTTNLGALVWTPVTHGKTLWQIGVADRSTREFMDGDNVRHYGNFLRYPKSFPDDVTFTIGKSREDRDWNFAQWSWYSKKPVWTIRFNLDHAQHGTATLTLGLASATTLGDLQVKVNGREVAALRYKKSGAAAYRSGGQDSAYNLSYVPFDASLLREGTNEITLGDTRAVPFSTPPDKRRGLGCLMYDAIRLEVAAK